MSQPIVYLSKEFFINFCKVKDVPTDDIQKKRVILYFEELIFYKAKIYINIEDAEIIRYLRVQSPKELVGDDEQIFLVNFKRILNQNRPRSCKDEIDIFKNKNYSGYNDLPVKPHFILASYNKDFCRQVEKEFGVICVSKELSFQENCTRADIKIVEPGKPIDLPGIAKNVHFFNSIIIEDPYLFENDIQGIFLELLLKNILSKDLKVQIIVTLIADNSSVSNIDAIVERIVRNIGLNIIIEPYSRSSRNIHDRNIYTNSFWLSCDYGFRNQYKTTTKWTIFPLGIYFTEYLKRKNDSVKFIRNEKQKSVNYIVN